MYIKDVKKAHNNRHKNLQNKKGSTMPEIVVSSFLHYINICIFFIKTVITVITVLHKNEEKMRSVQLFNFRRKKMYIKISAFFLKSWFHNLHFSFVGLSWKQRFKFKIWPLWNVSTIHSSEIRGLCLMKCSYETLQNLLGILLEYETPCSFFVFHFMLLYIFP